MLDIPIIEGQVPSDVLMRQALSVSGAVERRLRLCARGTVGHANSATAKAALAGLLATALALGLTVPTRPARALQIEITGGGADRLERQRSWAQGDLPLPGTPELGKLPERLATAGLKEGAAIFVRIFKAESELELWLTKGRDFQLFATYPICQWSGVLGPKFYEGDNQSPEGFYTVGRRDLKWQTRHHRAFNIGFPNAFDKLHGRTGSNILVHGGCSTEGCFAMTNPVVDEIFRLANSAIANGQKEFQVHVFPFRMTAENLLQQAGSPWLDFWVNLKTGYDLFAETRVPPAIRVCKGRYAFDRVPEFGEIAAERDCDGMPGMASAGPSPSMASTGTVPAASASPVATSAPATAASSVTLPSPIPAPGAAGTSIISTGSLRATAGSPDPEEKPHVKQATPPSPKAESESRQRRAMRPRTRGGSPAASMPATDGPAAATPSATIYPTGT